MFRPTFIFAFVIVLSVFFVGGFAYTEHEQVQVNRLQKFFHEHANETGVVGELPSATCHKAAAAAQEYSTCGVPYLWGGANCNACSDKKAGGLDCSGMVMCSFRAAGYEGIGRTTKDQIKQGSQCSGCSPSDTRGCSIGDLFFYCFEQPCPSHVVMYIGNGRIAECPHTGENCHVIAPYTQSYYGCRNFCP